MICPYCGANLPDTARMCYVCKNVYNGEHWTSELREETTAPQQENTQQLTTPQVEVTKVRVKVSKKVKVLLVLAIVLVVAGITAFFVIKSVLDKNAAKEYMETMKTVSNKMLVGAAKAEETGSMIHDIWSNTIFEKEDPKTDQYTKNETGSDFNDDFNTSLTNYVSSDEYQNAEQEIRNNQVEVQRLMKELQDPPDKYKEAYSALKDYYDAYLKLTNCAINPTGNLTSYTQDLSEADNAAVRCYQSMDMYLDK